MQERLNKIQKIIDYILKQIQKYKEEKEKEKVIYRPPIDSVPLEIKDENPWLTPNPSKSWAKYPYEKKKLLIQEVRKICSEEKLLNQEVQELIATIQGESGFNPACVNEQSKDYGLCQFSQRWYLKEYKMTPQYACEHPIECARIMAKNWRKRKNNWVAFSSGGYRQWLHYSDEQLAKFDPK